MNQFIIGFNWTISAIAFDERRPPTTATLLNPTIRLAERPQRPDDGQTP